MIESFLKIAEKWWFWMLLCILLYANTINHSYVIDDQIVITRNSLTQKGVEGISEIFSHSYLYGYDGREDESYRPLALTTFALERSLFDANPKISHAIQVLLYGLTVLVLFKLLISIFGEAHKKWITAVVLLYAAHPIHTEVVANVKSRDELMCALFLFGSLLHYSKWLKSANWGQLLTSLILYFFATLSKETAITSFLLFPAVGWYVLGAQPFKKHLHITIYFIPLIIYFAIRSVVLSDVLIQDPIDPVANSLALASNTTELFASNLAIFAKYIQLAVFPIAMSWDYSVSQLPITGFGSLSSILGLLLFLLLIFILIKGLWRRKIYGFGALVFFASFLPVSNFLFLINCPLGERFLFVPSLGILLIIVPFLVDKIEDKKWQKQGMMLLMIFIGYFSIRTLVRNTDWKNNLSIYEAGVRVCPNSVKTHFNLGTECIVQGDLESDSLLKRDWYDRAVLSLENAEKSYSKYVNIYENQGYVYGELSKLTNDTIDKKRYLLKGKKVLGVALDSLKYTKKNLFVNQSFILTQLILIEKDSIAKKHHLEELLDLVSHNKEYDAEDYHHEIFALNELRRYQDLLSLIRSKAKLYPEKADLIAEMSRLAFARNDYLMSYNLLNEYLKIKPGDLSSMSNKGMLLEILGRKEEALKTYEEVLSKDPNHQHAKALYEKLK